MATPPRPAKKRSAKPAVNAPATARARTAVPASPGGRAKPVAAEPSLRFHHSQALRQKIHAVLAALEAAPDHGGHGEAVAELVAELTEAGMDYYYLRALKLARVGRERLLRYCARPPFALDRPRARRRAPHLRAAETGPRRQWPAVPDPARAARPPRRAGAAAANSPPPLLRRCQYDCALCRPRGWSGDAPVPRALRAPLLRSREPNR